MNKNYKRLLQVSLLTGLAACASAPAEQLEIKKDGDRTLVRRSKTSEPEVTSTTPSKNLSTSSKNKHALLIGVGQYDPPRA